ncbi:MAG TPA: MaoC family dehydratase [Rhodocyclaceae bacterium]|nr:MaoC family dehydratase [Rhodocyclaceae bacterium]
MDRYIEDLSEGMSASLAKTVTEADIVLFAGISTDINSVHLDEEFAKTTPFGGRIAHGMLSASFISAALGAKLPGPGTIYLAQSLKFKAPVRAGDTVTATVTITEIVPEKKRVKLDTVCTVAGKTVIEGDATVMFPSRPA